MFNKKIEPSCMYCQFSTPLKICDDFLCSKYGIVKIQFKCRHFKYSPLKRIPEKKVYIKSC